MCHCRTTVQCYCEVLVHYFIMFGSKMSRGIMSRAGWEYPDPGAGSVVDGYDGTGRRSVADCGRTT